MAERVGQQLGNYQLLNLLGQGGFAEVYLGEHIHLGTKAAIKLLHTRIVEDEVALFKQEARTLANLVHPNIVRVLDFGVESSTNTPYLIMDYAPGGTMRQRHPKGARLPLSTVVEYVKQVAAALQYAHDEKLVHRDVKPENMLLGRNDEVLLSDFGLALLAQSSRSQSTKDMAGTIAYMAPEQIGAHPRPASDQYSLAVVVYEWLCGTRPFNGTLTELAVKHSITPPPPLRDYLPTLPPAVEQVILTTLAKQPQDRFSSVRAFATALEQASCGIPAQAGQPTASAIVTLPAQPISSTSSLTTQPQPSTLVKQSEVRGLSRRTVLVLLTGGVVGVGVIGISIQLLTRTSAVNTASSGRPFSTPTPQPQGTPYVIYQGHSNAVYAVAWSPNGKRIVSGSDDHTAQVWDAATGGNSFIYRGHPSLVDALAWSPDSTRIASGSSSDISPASGDHTVQVWDAANGGHVFTYRGHSAAVQTVAWSPNGQRIASGGYDSTAQVWDAANGGHVFTYHGHSNVVRTIAWSPDGTRIASGSSDNTVQVWDAVTGGHVFTYHGHSSTARTVAWSPDGGRIASGSYDHTVQVWDAANGGNVLTYLGHSDRVSAVVWSPDGTRIASGSNDRTVQVWDAATRGNVFTYHGHSKEVWAVVWSPDGTRIASGSPDETVQVWQAV